MTWWPWSPIWPSGTALDAQSMHPNTSWWKIKHSHWTCANRYLAMKRVSEFSGLSDNQIIFKWFSFWKQFYWIAVDYRWLTKGRGFLVSPESRTLERHQPYPKQVPAITLPSTSFSPTCKAVFPGGSALRKAPASQLGEFWKSRLGKPLPSKNPSGLRGLFSAVSSVTCQQSDQKSPFPGGWGCWRRAGRGLRAGPIGERGCLPAET